MKTSYTMLIDAIVKNLNRGLILINQISDENYANTSVPPYFSSIGEHMRHILDVFNCIFEGYDSRNINLINRKRNILVENYTLECEKYFSEIIDKLSDLDANNFKNMYQVTDNLGTGEVTASYTLESILIQAHSHAIHHFAAVGYIIAQLGVQLPDDNFGFNPTTQKKNSISD